MNAASACSSHRALLLLTIAVATSAGMAQVPPGHIVVSAFNDPSTQPAGDGGIFIVDPATGQATPVTGLPADLTGAGSGTASGANCVLIDSSSEALWVGNSGPSGTGIAIHRLDLAGSAVIADRMWIVGGEGSPYGGGVVQLSRMLDGRILFAAFGITSGPLAGASLGIVDPMDSPGQIAATAVPLTLPGGVSGALNALCIEPDGSRAWFTNDNGAVNSTSTLYSVPIPAGGSATASVVLCANVAGLEWRFTDGHILATGLAYGCAGQLFDIVPSSGQFTTCAAGFSRLNAIAVAWPTLDKLVAARVGGGAYQIFRVPAANCAATLVSSGPSTPWGIVSGVDAATDPVPPHGYCYAGVTSHGCLPVMTASSTYASIIAGPGSFVLTCDSVEGQRNGVIFYGTSGTVAIPWGSNANMYLCVNSPLARTPLQNTSGTDASCDGSMQIDFFGYMAAHPSAAGQPLIAGQTFDAQGWFRDPPTPKTSSLTAPLEFVISP